MARPSTLPVPLIEPYVDLRDFQFMPLDVVRLRDSDLVSLGTAECFRAAVMLWCASWHQVPAGSVPDDDRVLSKLAGYGFAVEAWQKVREGALHGFVRCDDGRFYHPVVIEKAREAWKSKLDHAFDRECGRVRKANKRNETNHPLPVYEEWLSGYLRSLVQEDTPPASNGTPHIYMSDVHGTSGGQPPSVPMENALKGQGEGQGQGQGNLYTQEGRAPGPNQKKPDKTETPGSQSALDTHLLDEAAHHERFEELTRLYPKFSARPDLLKAELNCRLLIENGHATWDVLKAKTEAYAKHVKGGGVSSPKYVTAIQNFFAGGSNGPWTHDWKPPEKDEDTSSSQEAAAAWDLVIRYVKAGGYRGTSSLQSPGDPIDKAVRAIGGYALLGSKSEDEMKFFRARFIRAWLDLKDAA